MSDVATDMSLQESCIDAAIDAAHHVGVEVRLLASKANELEAENERLRELLHEYAAENDELRKRVEESDSYAVAQSLECKLLNALDENQELREQKKRLVALLLTDYNLNATWDGLRQVWHIELTGDGYVLRDKACEVEAENAKLKDVAKRMLRSIEWGDRNSGSMYWPSFSYRRELRKLGVEVDE